MLFSLKLQRDNRKMPQPWIPPRGKLEKKLYFSPHCGDETTTYYNRAIRFYFVQGLSRQKMDIPFFGVPKNRPTNTPFIESANEKTEEKTVFSPCGRDKKATSYDSTLSKLFRFVFITRTVYQVVSLIMYNLLKLCNCFKSQKIILNNFNNYI